MRISRTSPVGRTRRGRAAQRTRRRALLTALALLIAACGCLELARAWRSHPRSVAMPVYKVGAPYRIDGAWYRPAEDYAYKRVGLASFYGGERHGTDFHGRPTANGEIYDMNALTAAHATLPMPSVVRVTNLENGRSIVLRVNDRGPFVHGRIVDVSRRAAQMLGFERQGVARVRVEILAAESRALKEAMLRGRPAELAAARAPNASGSTGAVRTETRAQ